MKHSYLILFIIMVLIIPVSCNEKSRHMDTEAEMPHPVGVYNFEDKRALAEYLSLNLDETHPNLLNPEISSADYRSVVESWTDLHQRIGKYLSDHDFSWNVEDSTITIVQKIYFTPGGEISHYFFNIQNENVTSEKKEQFGTLITEFIENHRISIQKEEKFAQCGKTKYLNK